MYIGEWKLTNGRKVKHGQGKITFPGVTSGQTSYGQEEYEGMWEEDKMHGQGRYTFTSGAEYNGQWVEGRMHGFGKMVYADGTSYEGSWAGNLMHGDGLYVDAEGVQWTGIFVNGSFESKIQKKLKADKELLDRVEEYKSKAQNFFAAFIEVFSKSDKKSYKDNLAGFFASAETCIDYVQEPYTKYEERLPDKWNEIFNMLYASSIRKEVVVPNVFWKFDSVFHSILERGSFRQCSLHRVFLSLFNLIGLCFEWW